MGPDFWTAFVFFGFPLVVGLLGIHAGGRFCYRAYLQYSVVPDGEWDGVTDRTDQRNVRGNLIRGVPILLGALLLTAHSARWLFRIFGVL